MTRYGKDQKAITRQRILDEAERTLFQQGPNGVVLETLMRSLDLTHGGFYAHFPSREDLVFEVVREMCLRSQKVLLEYLERGDPYVGLMEFFEEFLSNRHVEAGSKSCPVAGLAAYLSQLDDRSRREYLANYDRLMDKIAVVLRDAGVPGAYEQAVTLFSEASGAIMTARGIGASTIAETLLQAVREDIVYRVGMLLPA